MRLDHKFHGLQFPGPVVHMFPSVLLRACGNRAGMFALITANYCYLHGVSTIHPAFWLFPLDQGQKLFQLLRTSSKSGLRFKNSIRWVKDCEPQQAYTTAFMVASYRQLAASGRRASQKLTLVLVVLMLPLSPLYLPEPCTTTSILSNSFFSSQMSKQLIRSTAHESL